jgi:hypothetical protein
MSRSLINLLGALVCVSVFILAVSLGVVPQLTQAVSVADQSSQTAETNAIYRSQIDELRAQEERLGEIQDSIAAQRRGVPNLPQLDDVFELIARSAEASGVGIETITAGSASVFVERAEAVPIGAESEEAASASDESNELSPTPDASASAESASPSIVTSEQGMQVTFTISATATDMAQVVSFLDGLRSSPRLFSTIECAVAGNGTGLGIQISALAFYLPAD